MPGSLKTPSATLPSGSADTSSAQAKQTARKRFEDVYLTLRADLISDLASQGLPQDAIDWFGKSLDHNLPGGKLNRGLSVVDSVAIMRGRALSDKEYLQAAILGWCVELVQAYLLVADDLMDGSITRRGQPCWYRVEGVGLLSVNDSEMLENAIYVLLKKYFRDDACYVDLLELFHDITYKTEMGQLVDLITAPEDHVDLDKFSLDRHRTIVIFKTAYYSFYLPVALAMHLCRIPSARPSAATDAYKVALDILLPLGEYFQVQDDFLDFAGTPEQIGKIGTDILDNKCSWCINTALAVCSPEQRAVLDECYGRKDAEKEKKVREVFEAVDLRRRYEAYEENAYMRISAMVAQVPEAEFAGAGGAVLKREVFTSFLEKIYKRSK